MTAKNFDRVFYFTYTPGLSTNQFQSALNIDFSSIMEEFDVVDIQQSTVEDKIVVTLFARKRR